LAYSYERPATGLRLGRTLHFYTTSPVINTTTTATSTGNHHNYVPEGHLACNHEHQSQDCVPEGRLVLEPKSEIDNGFIDRLCIPTLHVLRLH
jgi:hypothetical protein